MSLANGGQFSARQWLARRGRPGHSEACTFITRERPMTTSVHYRACHLCEAICGLRIEVTRDSTGQQAIQSIKGDSEDTFSRGHICPKAVALQDI